MRRRPRRSTGAAPVALRVFRWRDWAKDPREALHMWGRARFQYWEQHPDAWPHALAVLAGAANVRAKMRGWAPMYPEYDEGHREWDGPVLTIRANREVNGEDE